MPGEYKCLENILHPINTSDDSHVMSELAPLKVLLTRPEQDIMNLYKALLGLDELIEGAHALGANHQCDEFRGALEKELSTRYPGHGKQLTDIIIGIMDESDKA